MGAFVQMIFDGWNSLPITNTDRPSTDPTFISTFKPFSFDDNNVSSLEFTPTIFPYSTTDLVTQHIHLYEIYDASFTKFYVSAMDFSAIFSTGIMPIILFMVFFKSKSELGAYRYFIRAYIICTYAYGFVMVRSM
jgi:hypothetical protein